MQAIGAGLIYRAESLEKTPRFRTFLYAAVAVMALFVAFSAWSGSLDIGFAKPGPQQAGAASW